MKNFALTLVGLCAVALLPAQKCGTLPPPQPEMSIPYEKDAYINASNVKKSARKIALKGRFSEFVIQFYLVFPDESPKALVEVDLENSINTLNHHFSAAKVSFTKERKTVEVKNSELAAFDMPLDEQALSKSKKGDKVIHVFLVTSIKTSNDIYIDGYTYHPSAENLQEWQKDMIIISMGKISDPSTFSHEMGHFFGLKHTHEFSGTGRAELVERHLCKELGDGICDTPADPNLFAWVDNDGNYTGKNTDSEGNTYHPMVENLMSYAPSRFRNQFTIGQLYRIEQNALFKRQYLISGSSKPKEGKPVEISYFPLIGAFEQFCLGGPRMVLLFIEKDSAKWSERMNKELEPIVQNNTGYTNLINRWGKYTLVKYDADMPESAIPDFLGNNMFSQPNEIKIEDYKALSLFLRKKLVEYPALVLLEFDGYKEFDYQIVEFFPGYQKPRQVDKILRTYGASSLISMKK